MTQFNPDLIQINASSKQTGSARDAAPLVRGGVADKLLNTQKPIFETAKFGYHNNLNNTITTSAAVGKTAEAAVASAGGSRIVTGNSQDEKTSGTSRTDTESASAKKTEQVVKNTVTPEETPKTTLIAKNDQKPTIKSDGFNNLEIS